MSGADGTVRAQCSGYSVEVFAGPKCPILNSWAGDARSINRSGDVCLGFVDCAEVGHSIIWFSDGSIAEIPPLKNLGIPAPLSDLNDSGNVTGRLNVEGMTFPLGFLYFNGRIEELYPLSGDASCESFALSDSAVVVGYSSGCDDVCRTHAVLWESGVPSALKLPMGPKSKAYDISDSGEYICGWMGVDPHPLFGAHAFRWSDGSAIDLGTPLLGCDSTEARAVNNLGQVCGAAYYLPPEGFIRGFLWTEGVMQEIDVLASFEHSIALDVNDNQQVLVFSFHNSLVGEPSIWKNGSMIVLDDAVPADLNIDINYAYSINNAGQIAAKATRPGPNGIDTVALRLTPIPSPIGDSDCDSDVDVDDLLSVINHWADASPKGSNALPPGDFDHDGVVELDDLAIVLDNWTF